MNTLTFLLVADTDSLDVNAFVALPVVLEYGASGYYLAAVDATTAQLAAYSPPGEWSGSVGDARALLRENNLIHWWWLFDWFAWSRGLVAEGAYHNFT